MNEHQTSPLDLGPRLGDPAATPPPLPGPVHDGPLPDHGPHAGDPGATGSRLDQAFATLRRSPLRRDSDRGVLGGVCAGIARSSGLSVAAVRTLAVLSALLLGAGVGVYVIAWALLPDGTGRSHLEEGMRRGRGRSLLVLALGLLAAVGILTRSLSLLAAALPSLLAVAALAGLGWWAWGRMTR